MDGMLRRMPAELLGEWLAYYELSIEELDNPPAPPPSDPQHAYEAILNYGK